MAAICTFAESHQPYCANAETFHPASFKQGRRHQHATGESEAKSGERLG